MSNFARPGRESRHNRAYWQHRAYAGIGPGAHSYAPPVRSWNVQGWAEQAGTAVRLTRSGWLLLDRLAVDLAVDPEDGRG